MNTDRLLAAGIALCCIFAIGASASTLGKAVHTNPDDVIDVNYKSLPINPTDAGELKREAQSKGAPTASQSNDQQQQSNQQQRRSSASKQAKHSESNSSWQKMEFLDDLLALLRKLVRWLVWIVPVFVIVGGVAAGVRFRNRLFGGSDERNAGGYERTLTPAPTPDPSNEVEQAWWAMVERFGVDRPHIKTPGECAREAIDAGGDEDAVRTLTRTFEEVRYGGEPITDDRLGRIHHETDRLGMGS